MGIDALRVWRMLNTKYVSLREQLRLPRAAAVCVDVDLVRKLFLGRLSLGANSPNVNAQAPSHRSSDGLKGAARTRRVRKSSRGDNALGPLGM